MVCLLALGVASCGRRQPASHLALHEACAPGQGAAADFRDWIARIVTSADSEDVAQQTSLQLEPVGSTRAVAFERDPQRCAEAAVAVARAANAASTSPTPVYLLRVGRTRYVAWSYVRAGEFFVYYVFDRQLKLLTSFVT